MAEFECQLCMFRTARKDAYNSHLNTRKHINRQKSKIFIEKSNGIKDNHELTFSDRSCHSLPKIVKSYHESGGPKSLENSEVECEYCHKHLSGKYSLARHLSVCKVKIQHDAAEEERHSREVERMKFEQLLKDKDHEYELALERKEVEHLKREISIKDQCSRATVKTYNNALKFAKIHFLNPKDLSSYDCRFVEENCTPEDTMDLVDKFIHHEINEMGPSFITDIICKYYKTPNIFDQSIHNSDVQRRTFVLYLKKMWSWDKEGNIVKSEIITPFLKQMIQPLNEYMANCNKRILVEKNFQSALENSYTASKVVTLIENGCYSDKVLATLASKFYLDINDKNLITA